MKSVTVLSSNREESQDLCRLLDNYDFKPWKVFSIAELDKALKESNAHVLVMDIDAISLTKSFINQLKVDFPKLKVLSLSKNRFHPDLKEIIPRYVHACLSKPIDAEELIFWLQSIEKDSVKDKEANNEFGKFGA